MTHPRFTAFIVLFFLIGSLSLLCINALHMLEPAALYQGSTEHVEGKIVAIGTRMDFVLEATNGQRMHFSCRSTCHTSLQHLQRHLYEQADTIVYYIEGPQRSLLALDVD